MEFGVVVRISARPHQQITHRSEHLVGGGEVAIAKPSKVLARAAVIHIETLSGAECSEVGAAQQRADRIIAAGRAAQCRIFARQETADGGYLQSPVVDDVGGGGREAAVGAGGGEGR